MKLKTVHIRWMIRRDMGATLAIEAKSFEFAWSEDDFVKCLRQRNCIGMVAEHQEQIVGYMVHELHRTRLHLLNMAVHPCFRRSGVGLQMVAKLKAKLSPYRRTRISLNVRETNLAAQLFFRSQGFVATGILREHYEETSEDAYRMVYAMNEPAGVVA